MQLALEVGLQLVADIAKLRHHPAAIRVPDQARGDRRAGASRGRSGRPRRKSITIRRTGWDRCYRSNARAHSFIMDLRFDRVLLLSHRYMAA